MRTRNDVSFNIQPTLFCKLYTTFMVEGLTLVLICLPHQRTSTFSFASSKLFPNTHVEIIQNDKYVHVGYLTIKYYDLL